MSRMEYFAKIDEAVDEKLGTLCERYGFQRLFNAVPEAYHSSLKAAFEVAWYDGAEFGAFLSLENEAK